ncbi:hypothetical protein CTEN210_08668 [Chaetoceros tenuissimus]|uniref:Receptor expression-enhancing protein n=1 Tax=Chaetoceros tenuissimus TaxID=426638 RepID=A0AAD3CU93_9STRA|nr:hypothetical protein CTEN210_08668 [Chaetoceros tenuissimus]
MTLPPQVTSAITKVDTFMDKYPVLTQRDKLEELEKKTGQPKAFFLLGGVSVIALAIYALGGTKLVTDLVSFIYPAYMSFKALDSANATEHTQWLTYWVVFSFVSIFENVFGFITEFIPFYFVIKVSFFVWLYHPKFMGSTMVYSEVIRPFVIPHLTALQKKSVPVSKKDT